MIRGHVRQIFEEVISQIRVLVNEQIDAIEEKEGKLPKVSGLKNLAVKLLICPGSRFGWRIWKLPVFVQPPKLGEQTSWN